LRNELNAKAKFWMQKTSSGIILYLKVLLFAAIFFSYKNCFKHFPEKIEYVIDDGHKLLKFLLIT
jgi:hypothetical protein